MSRLSEHILNQKGSLICYFPLGDTKFDPIHMAGLYLESGVDVLELGIPSKTPYLDGEIVTSSMGRALKDKSVLECLSIITKIREEYPDSILQAMCYKSLFNEISWEELNSIFKASKLDGLLVADADHIELVDIRENLYSETALVSFVPFDYDSSEFDFINTKVNGYVFFQAVSGPTGARDNLDPQLKNKIQNLKANIKNVPVCAGFGISKPEHCKQIAEMGADGVIIGSATLSKMLEGEETLITFLKDCKNNLM